MRIFIANFTGSESLVVGKDDSKVDNEGHKIILIRHCFHVMYLQCSIFICIVCFIVNFNSEMLLYFLLYVATNHSY